MVFVKVRETYDLHTKQNKMTVIGIHTPKPDIIKRNYPGLLMQCKAYRPVSADVRIACASVLPLDPLGVGTSEGAVAPEDVFNPILFKAMSNKGMSQLEARINSMRAGTMVGVDIDGNLASVDTDDVTGTADEFAIYYGLLSNTHDWKHANPQAGLEMKGLRPLVYEMVYNVGDSPMAFPEGSAASYVAPAPVDDQTQTKLIIPYERIIGKAKEFPFLNCTSYTSEHVAPGFDLGSGSADNHELDVPYLHVFCGCIIVPPSRRHEMFYRMVVEWTLEFSGIRPLSEVVGFPWLGNVGASSHYQNYSYSKVKEAVTGDDETILSSDACMVSSNVDVEKVM